MGQANVKKESEWNYIHIICALIITFLLQNIILPEFTPYNNAKMIVAFIIDGLVILRTIIARIRREKGRGWILYIIVLYASMFIIELASWYYFYRE
jgi:hypothetical protein